MTTMKRPELANWADCGSRSDDDGDLRHERFNDPKGLALWTFH
jgi:hypothetical protein